MATKGLPPLPPKSKISNKAIRATRKRYVVWKHFTKIKTEDGSKPKVACNFCRANYAYDTKNNGTRSMLQCLEKMM